jgi:hypothetical protein
MSERLEPAFVPARLALLLEHFAEIDDDREKRRVAYPLKEVLLLVTCATIASCDDFEEIVSWGEQHLSFLRRFSDFHHGVPCARWLRDLMNRIDPTLFTRCFESFVASMWPGWHDFIAMAVSRPASPGHEPWSRSTPRSSRPAKCRRKPGPISPPHP